MFVILRRERGDDPVNASEHLAGAGLVFTAGSSGPAPVNLLVVLVVLEHLFNGSYWTRLVRLV